MKLQLRQRAVALAAALVLVVCNLLALHHQATVRHAEDAHGIARHLAAAAGCREATPATHAHQAPIAPASELDACDLGALAHASAIAAPAPAIAASRVADHFVVAPPIARAHAFAVPLHAAPKTSPPLV